MAPNIFGRLANAYNAFRDRDPTNSFPYDIGTGYSTRPDRPRLTMGNERSIVSSVYTRIGIDVAAITMQHVRLDLDGRFLGPIDSGLNNCLTLDANIDQTGRALIQDIVMSMCGEGCVAIVPVDTTISPEQSGSYDIITLRTAKIVQWYPYHVRLNLYNERSGQKEDIVLPKRDVAIVENPLYAVMNEPNSTLQRLIRKLNILDAIDEQSGSGKLDLIIQLPYVIKTELRKQQAEQRRAAIEEQLSGSRYGIAYTDGTEKVTQLNRPAENNLMAQIQFLTTMLYSQLGLTEAIFNGTADEKTMINYHNRTVEPILSSIADSMRRRFITKTARTQGQSIAYFRNPFGLIPLTDLASASDNFSRNAILTANELRSVMGYPPSSDNEADTLRNKNLNPPKNQTEVQSAPKLEAVNIEKGVINADS